MSFLYYHLSMKKIFLTLSRSLKTLDRTKKIKYLITVLIALLIGSNCYFIYLLYFSDKDLPQYTYKPAAYTGMPGTMTACAPSNNESSTESTGYYKYDPSTVLLNDDPFISSKKLSFRSGEEYSICGRYGEVPLYDTIDGPVNEMLSFCADVEASLLGSSIPKGKLFIINDGWAIFDIESGPDVNDQIKPSRLKFLKLEDVTTPFVLTDGKNSIPLKYAGVVKVIVKPEGYEVDGGDDPCHGSLEPNIDRESVMKEPTSFEAKFAHEKSILLQNTSNEITKHCGT